jgi:YcxB-like protein
VRERWTPVLFILAGALAGLGIAMINWDYESNLGSALGTVIGCTLGGVILAFLHPRWLKSYIRRGSRAYQSLPLAMTLIFDDHGITTAMQHQTSTSDWSLITHVIETREHLILYVAKLRAYVVKITDVPDADREPLRQLIRQKVSTVEVRA